MNTKQTLNEVKISEINLDDVLTAIHRAVSVSLDEIRSRCRIPTLVYARMIYAHYARRTGATISAIGEDTAHDHSTVSYWIKKFPDEYRFNPAFRTLCDEIGKELIKQTKTLKQL